MHGLPVSVRGGGHNVAGHAVGEGSLDGRSVRDAGGRGRPGRPHRARRRRRHLGRRGPSHAGARAGDARRPDLGHGSRRPDALRRHRLATVGVGSRSTTWSARRSSPRTARSSRPRRTGRTPTCCGPAWRRRQLRRRHPLRLRAPSGRTDDLLRRAGLRARRRCRRRSASGATSSPTSSIASARWSSSRTIPEDPGYPEAAWGRRVYTVAALFAGAPRRGGAPRAAPRAGPARDRLLGSDAVHRRPAAVRHGHPVRHAPLLLEEPLPRDTRRRDDRRDLRAQSPAALAEHPVVDLELRRGDGARAGGCDRLRRPVDALDGELRRDLGRAGRRRGEHRLGARRLGRVAPWAAGDRIYLNFPGTARIGR